MRIVTTITLKKRDTEWKVEKALCRPCLYKASLHLFQTVTPNTQLLFPYTISAAGAELMNEATLKATYPHVGLTWCITVNS